VAVGGIENPPTTFQIGAQGGDLVDMLLSVQAHPSSF
jgi:hypothetical protein